MKAESIIKRVEVSYRGIGKSFYKPLRKQNNTSYGKEIDK